MVRILLKQESVVDFERLVGELALFHETRQLVINAQGYFSDDNIRIVYYLL